MAGMGYATDVKAEPTTTQDKRLLDEGSFQKLLEAAYVLQKHSGTEATKETSPASNPPGHTQILAEIVETQNLIQAQHLNLGDGMKMIAEKAQKITGSDGVAIGVVEGDQLHYRAASGNAESLVGTRIGLDSSLSALCLFHGQLLQTPQSEKDPRFDPQICRHRNAKSVIAVPIYHDGKVAAVLELVSSLANAFEEHDVRSCQLMAGLVTEAIARTAELEWKQVLAVERATMLSALEKLKPQLERLAEPEASGVEQPPVPEPPPLPPPTPVKCGSCGHDLEASEVFCGACGTARDSGDIQNKWATLWNLRVASEQQEHSASANTEEFPSMDDIRAELERALPDIAAAAAHSEAAELHKSEAEEESSPDFEFPIEPEIDAHADAASEADAPESDVAMVTQRLSAPTPPPEVWTSAAKTRQWLDSVKSDRPGATWVSTQWHTHRANIYLAAAAIILLIVMFARPQSDPAVLSRSAGTANGATATTPTDAPAKDPKQDLTLFEKLLVGVGLAEAPPAPIDAGNPNTQVWVDVHTALYYCPGAELYGKTSDGKYTTQRDAQQDQFEPAFRKVCR